MECRIELIFVPVTDVDRAIEFYVEKVGFNLDMQARVDENLRFVQVTPPTSACSIAFGEGITEMTPGTQNSIQVVVPDAEAARQELLARGVDAPEVQTLPWGSFTSFQDPDGNTWTLQQLPPRGSSGDAAAVLTSHTANPVLGRRQPTAIWACPFDARGYTGVRGRPTHTQGDTVSVTPFQDLPLAERDREWDGTAAEKRVRRWADAEEEPNENYRNAHVWYDKDNKQNFTAYKLLICDVVDGRLEVVPRGVMAAGAVMQGSRGGVDLPSVDIDRVKSHLAKYYAKMDETAPWLR